MEADRDLRPGEPEGRARAGTQGTAAGRQGEEARPFARAGAGSHGGGPERDDVSAVLPRVDAASRLLSVVAKDALLVSDGGAATHLAPPPGEPRSAQPLDGSGRSAAAGEQPPQPVEGLPGPRRGIATRYLDNYPGSTSSASPPAPMTGPVSPPPYQDAHTIHELSLVFFGRSPIDSLRQRQVSRASCQMARGNERGRSAGCVPLPLRGPLRPSRQG